MLERLKALFPKKAAPVKPEETFASPDDVARWAAEQGLGYEARDNGGFIVSGEAFDVKWRLERAAPVRDFIHGAELRGRTEMGLNSDLAVLVLNRHLKEALENRAFAEFTDTLRTVADAQLPEEVRWLSMYEEVHLPDAPIGFHDLYAVLADDSRHAYDWINEAVATELMRWPPGSVNEQTPVLLMVLRGNVYLRMEAARVDLGVLAQASVLYPMACARARAALPQHLT